MNLPNAAALAQLRAQKNPFNDQPSELREALNVIRPYLRKSILFSVIAALLSLAPSAYMMEVYGRAVETRNLMTLLMLTVGVAIAYFTMEALEWAHSEEMTEAGAALDEKLSSRVFRATFDANIKRMPGGTLQPLGDLRVIRDFLPSPVLTAIIEAPVSLFFLLITFLIHPYTGTATLVGALIQVFITWLNEKGTQKPLHMANLKSSAAQQYADGSLRNAQVIEAMGMVKDIHRRWIERQDEFLKLQAAASERAGFYTALSKMVQITWGSLLLGLGAYLTLTGHFPAGNGALMIVVSIIGGQVLKPLVVVVGQWRQVVMVRDSWSRLEAFLESLPEKLDSMPLPPPRGQLVAEGIVATAPGTNNTILRGVSFGLNPGEVLAVIGPSASGKTTLARVLTGIWPSAGGKARLDGVDVHTWDKAELGPYVGYLPQGVELFDGSIADNIARFGETDMAKVEAAARTVGLHEFILTLKDGYNTNVGPDGARLSGGQRQRIGLARALYDNPVFVVLDEPNSSLDEAGDAALAQAILQAKSRGTTFVVITHRTSVLGVSDKILLLRDGAAQAFGPRDEVLAALAARQQGAVPPAASKPAPSIAPSGATA